MTMNKAAKETKTKTLCTCVLHFDVSLPSSEKKKTTLSDQIKGRVENVSTGWRIFFFSFPILPWKLFLQIYDLDISLTW